MSQKAQVLFQSESLIGRYVKLTKHRRRLGGFGIVKDLFWKRNEPWVVVQLPTGSRMASAVSWTDLARQGRLTKKNRPQLAPDRLIELAEFVGEMKLRSRRKGKKKNK